MSRSSPDVENTTMSAKRDAAVALLVGDGRCTYCHREFGTCVTWHGRNVYLGETADHVLPKAIGGRVTVPCCSVCNRIKNSLVFDSLADIQDYCLDRLLRDGSITIGCVTELRVRRSVRADEVTQEEIEGLRDWEPEEREGPLVVLEQVAPHDVKRSYQRQATGHLQRFFKRDPAARRRISADLEQRLARAKRTAK